VKNYLNTLSEIEAIDPMWLISIEPNNQFLFEKINSSFTEVTGWPPEKVIGSPIEEIMPEASHQLVRDKYTEAMGTGKIIDYVEIAAHPNGEKVAEIRVIPIKDNEGKVTKILGIAHDVTEKWELQKKLEKERDEFSRKLSAAAIRGQEAERNKISLELHDNVNQVLTTVKLYTELCASKAVDLDVFLPKCTVLLNESINEIRRLSKQLAAPPIGTAGLAESLKELVESIRHTQRATIQLNIRPFACTTIDEDLQLAMYRIAQEHLTNVLKHAQATIITVDLICTNSELSLTITDNGVGFDPSKKNAGIGITNMNSRATLFNGQLQLSSAEGEGCQLQVSFPVACASGQCNPRQVN
jgi:PAS domain S-box-containing protein